MATEAPSADALRLLESRGRGQRRHGLRGRGGAICAAYGISRAAIRPSESCGYRCTRVAGRPYGRRQRPRNDSASR